MRSSHSLRPTTSGNVTPLAPALPKPGLTRLIGDVTRHQSIRARSHRPQNPKIASYCGRRLYNSIRGEQAANKGVARANTDTSRKEYIISIEKHSKQARRRAYSYTGTLAQLEPYTVELLDYQVYSAGYAIHCGGLNNAEYLPGLFPDHSTLSRHPCLTSVPQLLRLLLPLPDFPIYRAPGISPLGGIWPHQHVTTYTNAGSIMSRNTIRVVFDTTTDIDKLFV